MSTSAMSEVEVNATAATAATAVADRVADRHAEPTAVVFIIGAGVVGTALATRLVRAGVPVAGLHGRQRDLSATGAASGAPASSGELPAILSESDVVIIAVRDERIGQIAERLVREKRLRREQVLLHTSGAIASAQALAIARPHVRAVGTLHPLVSFADARVAADALDGVAFGIEGDEPATTVARRLVRALGGNPILLDAETLPLYHVGAAIASNYVVALASLAQGLLVKAGVPRAQALPALIPLLSSVVQNLAHVGLPGALTGPVARGDVASVEQHVHALESHAPELLDLYRRLGQDVLRVAREKSTLESVTVTRLESLFRTGVGATGGTSGAGVPESAKEPTRTPRDGGHDGTKKKR
jgi:predicted short-subunit dehydrogenase-like oxidoreductase (DUF2520 family)